jgi:hypothetical protein
MDQRTTVLPMVTNLAEDIKLAFNKPASEAFLLLFELDALSDIYDDKKRV